MTNASRIIKIGKMKYENVILDFDGTIVDSAPVFILCLNELSDEFGYRKIDSPDDIREKSAGEVLSKQLGLTNDRLARWADRFRHVLKTRMLEAMIVQGMKDVFEELSPRYRIGILTSNSEEVVRHILAREGITTFDFIHPEAPIFEKDQAIKDSLDMHRLPVDRTVYIGDEVRDVEACRNVGMKIIAVTWGFNSKRLLERAHPDFLAERPEEILSLLA